MELVGSVDNIVKEVGGNQREMEALEPQLIIMGEKKERNKTK